MIRRRKSSEAGFTIVESLIASAILIVVVAAAYELLGTIFKFEKRVRDMTTEDRMIATLADNIRSNLARYQYSFDDNEAENIANMMGGPLPIAWSETAFTSRESCPLCPGELGYWIQPMSAMSGVVKITMVVRHRVLYPDGGQRQYTFLATYK